jgi:hypothetical protein
VNLRIDKESTRLRLTLEEARELMIQGELFEDAVVRFGVKVSGGALRLEHLVMHVARAELEAAIARAGKKDAGVYAGALSIEIDVFSVKKA